MASSATSAPPSMPPASPYPPAGLPPPMVPPPPAAPTSGRVPVALLVLVAIVVAIVIIAAVAWFLFASVVTPPSLRPEITFSTPSLTQARAAQFDVTAATRAYPGGSYRVNLEVDSILGTAEWLSATTSVTVNGTDYTVNWQDADGFATLNVGDRFTVSRPSGLPPGSSFRFILLWADGGTVGQTTWYVTVLKPVLSFTAVSFTSGNASFTVAGVSASLPISDYRMNLAAGGTFGSAMGIGGSGTPVTISISGTPYLVTWTDIATDGNLNSGDRFAVSGDGVPLPGGTDFQFVLLWYDGSLISSLSFAT